MALRPRKRAALFIVRGNQLLLIRRLKQGRDYYILPGGGVEPGETLVEAALREAKEETNLDVLLDEIGPWFFNNQGNPEYYFPALAFHGELRLGGPEALYQSDDNRFRLTWVDFADLPNLPLVPTEIRAKLLALFHPAEARPPVVLLIGRPGVGKSTVIQGALDDLGERAGGFYTREVRRRGKREGFFEIVTLAGETVPLATTRRDLHFPRAAPFGKYKVNIDGIEQVAIPALEEAMKRGQLVIPSATLRTGLDEVGPMELLSPAFCRTVEILLTSDAPALGTVVLRPNSFAEWVKTHPRVLVKEVTAANREQLPELLKAYIQQRQ